jgi:hypothetical protein
MDATRTPARFVALALLVSAFSFIGAWEIGWWAVEMVTPRAGEPDATVDLSESLALLPCALVSTLPFCRPRMQVVQPASEANDRSYRELFASLPDADSAVAKLRWNHGSEAEAARLLSVIDALRRSQNASGQRSANAAFEQLLIATWQDHPRIVTASICAWCTGASAIDTQLAERAPDAEWVRRVGARQSKRFQLLGSAGKLDAAELPRLAELHGELEFPGSASSARYVANFLIADRRWETLHAWVSKGLNGNFGLGDVQDLASLPPEIVRSAWEDGVRMGHVDARLTAHLLELGHRPALRWLLWSTDPSSHYLDRWASRSRGLAQRYVGFASPNSAEASRYYSAHWREIAWDAETRTWRRSGARGREGFTEPSEEVAPGSGGAPSAS